MRIDEELMEIWPNEVCDNNEEREHSDLMHNSANYQ